MKTLITFFSVLLIQHPHLNPERSGDFKLVKNQSSVALYERWVRHNGDEVRELKAEFIVEVSHPETLILLLSDEQRGTAWNTSVMEYRVLPGENRYHWLVYIRYNIPWPMNDNDCLLSFGYAGKEANGKVTEILFSSTGSSQFPVTEGVNRITGTQGKWVFEDMGSKIKVTYFIATDRSRTIPRWISDPLIHDNLCRTMKGFKNLLEGKPGD